MADGGQDILEKKDVQVTAFRCASCNEIPEGIARSTCCGTVYCSKCLLVAEGCRACTTSEIGSMSNASSVISMSGEPQLDAVSQQSSSSHGSYQEKFIFTAATAPNNERLPAISETEAVPNILRLADEKPTSPTDSSRIPAHSPEIPALPPERHPLQSRFTRNDTFNTNAPINARSLRMDASRISQQQPRGTMISLHAMDHWRLPPHFDANRDPMMCIATYDYGQPEETAHYDSGYLIDIPRHSNEDYKKIYRRIGFFPPENNARGFNHSNILCTERYAVYNGQIVGLFTPPIKAKLSDYLRDNNLSEEGRILKCQSLVRYFAYLETKNVLTAPITFDHLYLTDNPHLNTLKVPILPCTGNPKVRTRENRFFLDRSGNFSDYTLSHLAYNWAKLCICIMLGREPDFDTFSYDAIKSHLGVLEPSIRSCLDPDPRKRPALRKVLSELDVHFVPDLQMGE